MLCCVVLCCVVLCCVVLCCVVLCCAVLCCVVSCCAVLCCVCCVVLGCVVLCCVVLCCVVLCCFVLCCVGLCCVVLCLHRRHAKVVQQLLDHLCTYDILYPKTAGSVIRSNPRVLMQHDTGTYKPTDCPQNTPTLGHTIFLLPPNRVPDECFQGAKQKYFQTAQQHNTTQHNTTQHNTTQHNTTQRNTTQHNTTQHTTRTTYLLDVLTRPQPRR